MEEKRVCFVKAAEERRPDQTLKSDSCVFSNLYFMPLF